ncbi:MAG: MEDS domain-containing protein [Actinobacteria bacterium]|nr:MEDS domain-containing protein [Actinomycetota bacterium]
MYPEKITILIIEGNPADARLIKETLAEGNSGAFDLKYADRLLDGLKKISEEDFDIVLLDLSLPDSTGLEIITSISEKNKDIPLIILTGIDNLDVATGALDIGAQDYLVKGQFDGASLSRSIRYAIERKKIEVELKKSESKYRLLFNNMTTGFALGEMIYDKKGHLIDFRFLEVNSAFEKLVGQKASSLIGKTVKNTIPGEVQYWIDAYSKVVQTEEPISFQNNSEGLDKWYELWAFSPAKNQAAAIFTDITERRQAEVRIKENLSKLKRTFEQTITTLGNIIEIKDPYTSGHQKKVAAISMVIAKNLGLTGEAIEAIRLASLIHDIGKISIPASILSKPGKLTDIERAMIETHPKTGYDIVKEIDFPQPIAEIILQHHERINGSGYPSGLKGYGIMLEAKIIAVADVFEAMTSHRPYRSALSLETTMDELIDNKGTLYDPDVVDCLSNYIDSYYKIELGDHLYSVYNDFEVQISYIVPYMDIGLKKNHKCIYITDENSIESIINAFRTKGTNLSAYLEKGQFVFLTGSDIYLKDGYFDPGRMISLLKSTEKTALKEGFDGIRVTSEMTWILSKLPGTERFMEYENKLNEFYPGSKVTGICQYSESRFDKKILIKVIEAHPIVGINRLFYKNKFYKEPSAVSSNDELNGMDYKDIERKYYSLIEKIKN